jgi:hypothetical protein
LADFERVAGVHSRPAQFFEKNLSGFVMWCGLSRSPGIWALFPLVKLPLLLVAGALLIGETPLAQAARFSGARNAQSGPGKDLVSPGKNGPGLPGFPSENGVDLPRVDGQAF